MKKLYYSTLNINTIEYRIRIPIPSDPKQNYSLSSTFRANPLSIVAAKSFVDAADFLSQIRICANWEKRARKAKAQSLPACISRCKGEAAIHSIAGISKINGSFFSRVNVQQEAAGLQNGFGLQASLELRLESRGTYPTAKLNFLKNLALSYNSK